MSLRSNGSYIGPRPTGPDTTVASGIWDLRAAERQQQAAAWPLPPSTDPQFNEVVLLLHMDGSDGSTTFTDSSSYARTATVNGNAQIDTAQSKYGGAAGLFSGVQSGSGSSEVADCVIFSDSADYSMGSSDWTMEVWVRQTSNAENMEIASHRDAGGSQPFWLFRLNTDGTVRFYFLNSGSQLITDVTTTNSISLNTWHHVAVVRSSGSVAIYIDGVASGSGTNLSTAYEDPAGDFALGVGTDAATAASGWGGPYVGHIDEFRWTIGTARYTSNFTPPTEAFPDS